jgi:energy-coupling factor transporter ATP-binding protein EcfA2/energy-coupling factor transporter transmembrane protein EcfT
MLTLRGAFYRYPGGTRVGPVDLDVAPGELVVLTGPTGCGKSTVLRLAAGLAARHGRGERGGVVRIGEADPGELPPAARVSLVGLVAQDPQDQVVTGTLGDEIAFAPESAGWAPDRIDAAVVRGLADAGFPGEAWRPTRALSGGQRQKLVVAAALAAGARVLLLDEPLAHLDPIAARELVARLAALRDQGVAILVVEHRLEALQGVADRVVRMGEPAGAEAPRAATAARPTGTVVLEARGLAWAWEGRPALRGVDLTLRDGERVALLGANGSGKSTLLSALAGRIAAGDVRAGRVVDVPQDPDLALFSATVREELAVGPSEAGRDPSDVVLRAARALSVDDLLDRAPQSLSRGQRLRTAVAAAVATEPDVLILDEPTSGQDREQVEKMMLALQDRDGALIFATHDVDLARRQATRVIVLEDGRVVYDGAPGTAPEPRPGGEGGVPQGPVRSPPAGGLDPRARLGLLAAVGILAITLDRPASLALLAVAAALPVPFLGASPRTLGRAAIGLAVLTWGTVMSQALFYGMFPRTAVLQVGPLVVWREGVAYGAVQALRFVSVTIAGLSLVSSTPTDRLMAALVRLRVPFGLAFLALTALRFVPETAREVGIVRDARARRGRPAWKRAPWAWLALEVAMLRPVVARSLRRARVLAEALDARGFDPVSPRTERRPLRFALRDVALLGAAAAVTLAAAGARAAYSLYTADLWYVPAWRPLYAFVRAWL